jgi:lipopolysaccharide export LptBFGC system permease protein LptF
MAFPFTETPELIHSEIRVNRVNLKQTANRAQLPISEIANYLQLHPQAEHGRRAMLMTQLQGRLAAPLTCLTVVLIAIPFGARSGRRNVFVGVASSIVICFAYIVFQSVCLALGNGGIVPPVVAAWLPNALFGGIGMTLINRVR